MRRRKSLLFLFAFVFTLNGLGDFALAKYPEKKIRFIVAMAPGGGADLTARILTQYANPFLGGRLYVENVTGGAGAIGFREVAKSAPDGYTVLGMITSNTIGPHTMKGYPTLDLFDPICIMALDPTALTVKPDSRFKTAADLISFAKANPGAVTASNPGMGSANYLSTAAFSEVTGIKFTMVPYKGSNPALVAAMGGHVDVSSSGCSEAVTFVEGKKLRPLVTFGTKRSRLYPDVATLKELGYDLSFYLWRGVGVPKGTPEEVKNILTEAFQKAMNNEECKKTIDQAGLERVYLGPKEAGPWLKAQNEFFKNLAAKIGLQPE